MQGLEVDDWAQILQTENGGLTSRLERGHRSPSPLLSVWRVGSPVQTVSGTPRSFFFAMAAASVYVAQERKLGGKSDEKGTGWKDFVDREPINETDQLFFPTTVF